MNEIDNHVEINDGSNCSDTQRDTQPDTQRDTQPDIDNEMENLTFIRKKQHNNSKYTNIVNDENFFLNPSFEIMLKNSTIKDLDTKHITFKCSDNDIKKLTLLSEKIVEKFKSQITIQENCKIYDIGNEYLRCCLPVIWKPYQNKNNKYTILHYSCDFYLNNEKLTFNSNAIHNIQNYKIDKVIVEIKNIWKMNDKYAFNNIIKRIFLRT